MREMGRVDEGLTFVGNRLMGVEKLFQMLPTDAVGSPDADRIEPACFDEPLDMPPGNMEHIGGFLGGQNWFWVGGAF
jgi:hypothetical protein